MATTHQIQSPEETNAPQHNLATAGASNNLSLPRDISSLEANSPTHSNRPTSLRTYLNENIREDILLEMELLTLAFATGIQDATSYPDYFCFASNQTGNTVLLAIGVSGLAPDAFNFSNIGISLSLFVAGGWVAGQLGNTFGPRRRAWLLASSLVQTLMVWAAVMVQYLVPIQRTGPAAYVVLSLLAFSSSAQVAMARSLKMTEITTAMATAAYVDVLIDPDLYSRHNRGRNRRIAFLSMLAAGSFAGAYMTKGVNSAFSLTISAVLKTLAMMGLFWNKKMECEAVFLVGKGGELAMKNVKSAQ